MYIFLVEGNEQFATASSTRKPHCAENVESFAQDTKAGAGTSETSAGGSQYGELVTSAFPGSNEPGYGSEHTYSKSPGNKVSCDDMTYCLRVYMNL